MVQGERYGIWFQAILGHSLVFQGLVAFKAVTYVKARSPIPVYVHSRRGPG